MKIYCNTKIPNSKLVNKIGEYLYKNLDGAYKIKKDRNVCDVYITLLYQLKEEFGGNPNEVEEMSIIISITTYNDKIRIDTIELTPDEYTLGFDLIVPDTISDLPTAKKIVEWKVGNRIRKAYKNYLILF